MIDDKKNLNANFGIWYRKTRTTYLINLSIVTVLHMKYLMISYTDIIKE